jgi:hypothetical protein
MKNQDTNPASQSAKNVGIALLALLLLLLIIVFAAAFSQN